MWYCVKCPLNNSVSIVQKLVVKLSNTSTMLFPPVACYLQAAQTGFQLWRTFPLIHVYVILLNIIESVKKIVLQWLVVYLCKMILCMYCFYTMYMCDLWTSFFSRGDQLDCIALLTYLFPNIYIRNLDIHYFSCRFVFFYCFFYFFYFYFFLCFEDWKKLYICFTLIVIDPLIYYHWLFVVFVISDHRLEEG